MTSTNHQSPSQREKIDDICGFKFGLGFGLIWSIPTMLDVTYTHKMKYIINNFKGSFIILIGLVDWSKCIVFVV